jgi:16S rRNA processing protein RimM
MAPAPDDRIVIGRVVRPHGLAGEVVVESMTNFPERFREGLNLLVFGPDAGPRGVRILSSRSFGDRLLISFEGVDSVEAAEQLRNGELSVSAQDVAPPPPGFVYHWEIEGAEVFDEGGKSLGRVTDLVDVGGRPLLVIETPRGTREVPFTSPIVVSVDAPGKRVVLDPPPGLLD